MKIKIAEKLKELRKIRGNKQEDLADFLGITVQAISKWERGEGMPDIFHLPRIAGYYGVSVDTLLGVDAAAKENRINALSKEYEIIRKCPPREDGTLVVEHGIEEGIEHIRKALIEIPDCYFFMQLLASDLWYYSKSKEGTQKADILDEAESSCRRVLRDCTEDQYRHMATDILCLVLYEQGNKQQAYDLACRMPDAVGTNYYMLPQVTEGKALERELNISIKEFIRLAYMLTKKLDENRFDTSKLRNNKAIKYQIDSIIKWIYG